MADELANLSLSQPHSDSIVREQPKMVRRITQPRILASICALLLVPASAYAQSKQATSTRVLYLYGSVPPAIHQMRLSDIGKRGMSQFKAALVDVGLQLTEARDANVTLNRETLNRYKVLILGSNNRRFTRTEQEAVAAWVRGGGGLVAWSDSAFGGDYAEGELGNTIGARSDSDLTAQFGMRFLRDNGAGVFTIRRYQADHYLNNFDRNGGVVFRGEGVSLIRTREPANILARLQQGGSSGTVRLNKLDGEITEADAAIAVARVGQGRVVGTFDRNSFWNAGEGTRLSEVNNREYAQRLILWAASIDRAP